MFRNELLIACLDNYITNHLKRTQYKANFFHSNIIKIVIHYIRSLYSCLYTGSCYLLRLPKSTEHVAGVNLRLQLPQLVQSISKALINLVFRRRKASIARLHGLTSALDPVSKAIDPSGSVCHSRRLVVRVDEKLDVRLTQTERGGGVGLCGAAVIQEAGDGIGGSCLAQGLLEDVDDFWGQSGDGDAAGGRVSGQGNVLGCQALESVEGGFLRQYFWG